MQLATEKIGKIFIWMAEVCDGRQETARIQVDGRRRLRSEVDGKRRLRSEVDGKRRLHLCFKPPRPYVYCSDTFHSETFLEQLLSSRTCWLLLRNRRRKILPAFHSQRTQIVFIDQTSQSHRKAEPGFFWRRSKVVSTSRRILGHQAVHRRHGVLIYYSAVTFF